MQVAYEGLDRDVGLEIAEKSHNDFQRVRRKHTPIVLSPHTCPAPRVFLFVFFPAMYWGSHTRLDEDISYVMVGLPLLCQYSYVLKKMAEKNVPQQCRLPREIEV